MRILAYLSTGIAGTWCASYESGVPQAVHTGLPGTIVMTRGRMVATMVVATLAGACATHTPPMVAAAASSLSCRAVTPGPATSLTWLTPGEIRDRRHLNSWCSTVGPVVITAPARSTEAPIDRLAVISWNTHVGSGDVAGLIERLRRGDFTAGAPVHDFVLLLQEVYRANGVLPPIDEGAPVPRRIAGRPPNGLRRSIEEVARTFELAMVYAPSMRNGRRDKAPEDRGNAVLSTRPLDDPTLVELPFEKQRRVAVTATVAGRTSAGVAWRLRVAAVHIDTGLALTRGGPAAARQRQVDALIDALSASDEPIALGGDFNSWFGREPAIEDMRRALPDAPPVEADTWRGPLGLRATLDHVFARVPQAQQIVAERLPGRFGSDHFPLLAMIGF